MNEQSIYNRRALEFRAAAYYASIRKPESEWRTIEDLTPQLAEFKHQVWSGEYDRAASLLDIIDTKYLYTWGHFSLLAKSREMLISHLTLPNLQMINLGKLGDAYRMMGLLDESRGFYRQALDIACAIGDYKNESIWLNNLSSVYRQLGQLELALSLCYESLSISKSAKDREGAGVSLGNIGIVYRHMGQIEKAILFFEESLTIAQEVQNRPDECARFNNLGSAYQALGKFQQAIGFFEKGLKIAQEMNSRHIEGMLLSNLSVSFLALGQVEQSVNFLEAALTIAREIETGLAEAVRISRLGDVYLASGQIKLAKESYQKAIFIDRRCGTSLGMTVRLLGLARVYLFEGNLLDARQCCIEALELNVLRTKFKGFLLLAIVMLHEDNLRVAEVFSRSVELSIDLLQEIPDYYDANYTLAAALIGQVVCDPRWSDVSQRAALITPALAEYRRALDITAAPGVVRDALRDLELIHAAGIEGLEPVFELLKGVLNG